MLDRLGTTYKLHPYYTNRQSFYQLAGSMTVNLAVSLTESFGYFALESFMLGVPAVSGVTTPSVRDMRGPLRKCIVDYIDDPLAISDAVEAILDDYENIKTLGLEFCKKLAKEK